MTSSIVPDLVKVLPRLTQLNDVKIFSSALWWLS